MPANPPAPWQLAGPEEIGQDGEEREEERDWREEDDTTPLAPAEWLTKWQEDKAQWEAERAEWQRRHSESRQGSTPLSSPPSPPPRSTSPRKDTTRSEAPAAAQARPQLSSAEREAAPPERDGQHEVGWGRRLWDKYCTRAGGGKTVTKAVHGDRPVDSEDRFESRRSRPAGQAR